MVSVQMKSSDLAHLSVDGQLEEHAPTPSAFAQSIAPQDSVEELVEAKVLFDFIATSEFELEVRGRDPTLMSVP